MKLSRFLIPLLLFIPMTLVWSQPNTLVVDIPVILTGDQLAQLKGKEIQNIRVFSVKNGHTSDIPFQIDQFDSENDWVWEVSQENIWIDSESDWISQASKKNSATHDDEDPANKKIFDHNDQLLFMTTDLGERQPSIPELNIRSNNILQVQVKHPISNETLGWVYIASYRSKTPSLSSERYMNYHPKQKQIQSPIYKMSYSNDFTALMNQLSINDSEIVDRLKIRGKVKVGFLLFSGDIEFNEEEVDGYPAGYINGPIRTVKRVVNYVKLGAGMQSPSLNCDHLYYPNHAEIPIMLSKSVGVKNMTIRIGLDFHNAAFEHLYNDTAKEVQHLKNNNTENHLINSPNAKWMVLSGQSNSLFSSLSVPKDLHHLVSISPYVINNENLIDLPEKYPGAESETGFVLTTQNDFPSGERLLYMNYVLSTQSHTAGDGEKINELLTDPFKTKVTSMYGNY
ncbi:MAG: hypothetical protein OQL19_15050 [Gammaproteobacteria bacterium]|nr:hypothetical protein [Gammaproteobacteria bacterium]